MTASPDSTPTDPTPAASPAAAADPLTLYGADAVSGARFLRWNLGALVVGLVALGAGLALARGELAPATPSPEAHDPLGVLSAPDWDDGQAEVARYTAERVLYGQPQAYELVRIAVKERHDPATRTKPTRPTSSSLEAIKTVASHDVPTPRVYDYHQQVICRLAKADARRLLDATLVSAEWCGSTFALLQPQPGDLRREVHSYWDGEGDRIDAVSGDPWLEDQLPFLLRTLDLSAPQQIQLLPTLLSNRASATQPAAATVRLEAAGVSVTVPAGTYACDHVVVEDAALVRHYWIGRDALRPLVKFEDATGKGELASLERVAYWKD
jgi:hypothetical protein